MSNVNYEKYLQDITAHHQGIVFAEEISKIDEGRSHVWQSGHDKNLGRVRFNVFFNVTQLLDSN